MLAGISANSLKTMHESGELLEKYNSRRKADITLLGVSVIALGLLAGFEVSRVRRAAAKRRYGDSLHYYEVEVVGHDSSSIYAAPETVDVWKGRRTRSSRQHQPKGESGAIWMGLLQITSIFLPMMYVALLVVQLRKAYEDPLIAMLMPTLFGLLVMLSVVAAIGIFAKKSWGMVLGYTFALCNLMIFPYGTAAGLLLMMGLVGASPIFEVSASAARQAKKKRRSSAKQTKFSTI
jgi:hypothetical protein